ncbi:reverse transcriptase/maturase family protein [Candidatus Parcubacteria bacterium]|nr:reverse transcriptase/maturase family protein [Patescibacteria group bacterium]MBU4381001.1 reverse transcriptase/maturase family protein [Patescibacteria group bacterium]MCG2689312.1 reverse transcriptase/maturase family protein [Candidatus Parcubacteria bacterium]
MIKFTHKYQDIISADNLLVAWKEFRDGKRARIDVQIFEHNLMENILQLSKDLKTKSYKHSKYTVFKISDPKPRIIHKATVRDRLLHHALHRMLYPVFDKYFIADSYSCRVNKGSHAALNRFRKFYFKVSKNNTRTAWVLKCDIRKFFASIDHQILIGMLQNYISDKNIVWLLSNVINSFEPKANKGLPLGNLTSQLFANIYMDKFDKFVKYVLRVKFYIRYTDDFVFLSHDKNALVELLPKIDNFLWKNLCLKLNEDKTVIKTVVSGVDFLGWVHFPDHRVLRTATKRHMFKNIACSNGNEKIVQSYLGLISHGNTFKLKHKIAKLGLNPHNL